MDRTWPWGLVFLSDEQSHEELPERLDDAVVVGTATALVSRILHEVDGEATAEVWVDGVPDGLQCVYDACLALQSGRLVMSDAGMTEVAVASIEAGVYRARVYVDDDEYPGRVVVTLGAASGP